MKRVLLYCFIAALAAPAMAEDWAAVPAGKARIIVYGDFFALDINDAQITVDDEKAFPVRMSQKNVVLDLAPGRHYIKMVYPLIYGKPAVKNAGFFLAEGALAYMQYYMAGGTNWLHLVTPTRFESTATGRPSMRDPFIGGQQ